MIRNASLALILILSSHPLSSYSAVNMQSDGEPSKGNNNNQELSVVSIDFNTGQSTPSELPFDVPFNLRVTTSRKISSMELMVVREKYHNYNCEKCKPCGSMDTNGVLRDLKKQHATKCGQLASLRKGAKPEVKSDPKEGLKVTTTTDLTNHIRSRKSQRKGRRELIRACKDDTTLRFLECSFCKKKVRENYKNFNKILTKASNHPCDIVSADPKTSSTNLVLKLQCEIDELEEKIAKIEKRLKLIKYPDFNTCTRICSDQYVNLASKNSNGMLEGNRIFTFLVPPLRANTTYRFSLRYSYNTVEDRIELDKLLIPVMQSYFLDMHFGDIEGIVIDRNPRIIYLQEKLKTSVMRYYFETYSLDNIGEGHLLAEDKSEEFVNLLVSSNKAGKGINHLHLEFDSYINNVLNTADDFNRGITDLIANPVLVKLMTRLREVGTMSPTEKDVYKRLVRIDEIHNNRRAKDLCMGQIGIDEIGQKLPEIKSTRSTDQVQKYVENLLISEKYFRDLHVSLLNVVEDKSSLARLALTDKQKKEYSELISVVDDPGKSLSRRQNRRYDALNRLVEDFKKSLVNLIGSTTTSENLLNSSLKYHEKIKKVFEDMRTVYGQISYGAFNSISFQRSSGFTTTSDFVTRTGYYVSADIGISYVHYNGLLNGGDSPFSNSIAPYFGVNFHLGAINKQARYTLLPKRKYSTRDNLRSFYKNTSVIVGVSVNSLEQTGLSDTFEDKISLLTGVGIRISEPIRISYGVVWQKLDSNNPLLGQKTIRGYPYIALSYDLDVAKYLGSIASKIFGITPN